ncbi:MAG: hypothetical protein Q9164_006435, partial [Protoblastenia rupestris]
MVQINTILLAKEHLQAKIAEAKEIPDPQPTDNTKAKKYWIHGTVRNYTQFPIKVGEYYADSGRYEEWPKDIEGFKVGAFSFVNRDNAWAAASGGNSWILMLEPDTDFNIALGFTAPMNGSYKSAVVESRKPEDGYDNASENGRSFISQDGYSGKDEAGSAATIKFECVSTG